MKEQQVDAKGLAELVANNTGVWTDNIKSATNGPATTDDVRALLSLIGDLAEAIRLLTKKT